MAIKRARYKMSSRSERGGYSHLTCSMLLHCTEEDIDYSSKRHGSAGILNIRCLTTVCSENVNGQDDGNGGGFPVPVFSAVQEKFVSPENNIWDMGMMVHEVQ